MTEIQKQIDELEQSAADAEFLGMLSSYPDAKEKCTQLAQDYRTRIEVLRAATVQYAAVADHAFQ